MEGAIKKLFFFERREVLAVITETMMLSQYTLGSEGGAQEYMKVFNPKGFIHMATVVVKYLPSSMVIIFCRLYLWLLLIIVGDIIVLHIQVYFIAVVDFKYSY